MKTQSLSLVLLVPFVYANTLQQVLKVKDIPVLKSVAIIGGGASGTSAAFWLSNALPDVSITIFEKNQYIGGRSITVPIKDDHATYGSIELGASIFVEANKNLMKATEKFGLQKTQLTALADEVTVNSRPGLGVWDGKEFLFEETGSYWDSIKAVWRYGFTPLKFQKTQKAVVEKFMELYDTEKGFENVQEMIANLKYEPLLNQTAATYLKDLGINERFSNEILQTAARGNYCQNLNALHALAVMVSMEAGHGTWAVEGGNFQIFEEFAMRSRASIQLGTTVVSIQNVTEVDDSNNRVDRYIVHTTEGTDQAFDEVILTTPLKYANIELPYKTKEHARNYHIVHVTLVAGHTNPDYFQRTLDKLPTFIVSTGEPLVENFKDGAPLFQTYSVHRVLENGETVIKIFSAKKLEENELDQLFLNRTWVYRKEWNAFPILNPVTEDVDFPPFILKDSQHDESGIIYTNAFENFISTMETQTISGKNAARLLHDKWCNTEHGFNKFCQKFGDGWGKH